MYNKPDGITRIYFIRHCESDRTVKDGKIRPLTQKGYSDAQLLFSLFDGIHIDMAYCSPYKRAIETIEPLVNSRKLTIQIEDKLHERISDKENIDNWPNFFKLQWNDFNYTLSDGETLGNVQSRNIQALQEILSESENKTAIIGTHGMALLTVMNYYNKKYGYNDWMRILPLMPYIVCFDFRGSTFIELSEMNPTL
jgi:2,3-bisphosphoglycerate-dependent phosphoglycerate mutase